MRMQIYTCFMLYWYVYIYAILYIHINIYLYTYSRAEVPSDNHFRLPIHLQLEVQAQPAVFKIITRLEYDALPLKEKSVPFKYPDEECECKRETGGCGGSCLNRVSKVYIVVYVYKCTYISMYTYLYAYVYIYIYMGGAGGAVWIGFLRYT
jgi:hypothetical protein